MWHKLVMMLFVLQFWFSGVMVLNAFFNNILAISWGLVFCVQYLLNVFDHVFMSFCHSFVVFIYSHGFRKSLITFIIYNCIEYIPSLTGFELTTLVVIGTDCTTTI
jgi:hypothetical protein